MERPILFNGAMVRAILSGRKVQTRRIMKPQPEPCPPDHGRPGHWWPSRVHQMMLHVEREMQNGDGGWGGLAASACPYVQPHLDAPGDRLWVRETWMDLDGTGIEHRDMATGKRTRFAYAADCPPGSSGDTARKDYGLKWRPSIHMPRRACRIVLEITDVRVERLQDGEGDADFESRYLAEGINRIHHGDGDYYYSAFRNEPHPENCCHADGAFRELWTSTGGDWDANPWVWVIGFKRVEVAHG